MEMLKTTETLNEIRKTDQESMAYINGVVSVTKPDIKYTIKTEEVLENNYACSFNTQHKIDEHLNADKSRKFLRRRNADDDCAPVPKNIRKLSDLTNSENMIFTEHRIQSIILLRSIMRLFETNLKVQNDLKRLTCPHCKRGIIGKLSYYFHFMLIHNYAFQPCDNISGNISADHLSAVHQGMHQSIVKHTQILRRQCEDCSDINYANMGDVKELCGFRDGMKYAKQDIEYMDGKMSKHLLSFYTSDIYQNHLENLFKRNYMGQTEYENKLYSPFYWKTALFGVGLTNEYMYPRNVENEFMFTECMRCKLFYTSRTTSTEKPSILPCAVCYMTQTEAKLNKHKEKKHHFLSSPYFCETCSSEFTTFFEYVKHTIVHLRQDVTCPKCRLKNSICNLPMLNKID